MGVDILVSGLPAGVHNVHLCPPTLSTLHSHLVRVYNLHADHVYCVGANGRLLSHASVVEEGECVDVRVRGVGGKGGFGANLRSGPSGLQIGKKTNKGMMRTLDGRRRKDVEAEKRLKRLQENGGDATFEDEEYLAGLTTKERRRELWKRQKAKEKLEAEESAAEAEKQAKLAALHANVADFEDKLATTAEELEDALQQGFIEAQKAAEKAREEASKKRKRKLPAMMEFSDSSDDDDDEEDGDDAAATTTTTTTTTTATTGAKESAGDASPSGRPAKRRRVDNEGNSSHTDEDSTGSPPQKSVEIVDVSAYGSAGELEALGLDALKANLQHYGLKCGGTLSQRAKRLFVLKDTPIDKVPRKFKA